MLHCENYLKTIAKATNLYQADWDGQWPESLKVMEKYYPYKRIPTCPGNRNDEETSDRWIYYYFKPKVEEVVPVCWDSKPHYNKKAKLLPSIKMYNVLYSDGHIESYSETEIFLELFQLAKTNPEVLKVLDFPTEKNSKLPIFLFGIAIGIGLATLFQKLKGRFNTSRKRFIYSE